MRPLKKPGERLSDRYGPWALVTGASAGIGAEFVRQLARERFNVMLVARTEAKLRALADEVERLFGIQTRVVAVDLSLPDAAVRVLGRTEDLEVGLLVNNAGAVTPGAFAWRDERAIQSDLALNAGTPTLLAHRFGRQMSRRGRGAIVFVASTFAHQPVPYFQQYAATKAYLLSLGQAIHLELKPAGVDVMVLSPGPTNTAMRQMDGIDFSKMPLFWMDSTSVVKAALKGLRSRRMEVIPGLPNALMAWMGRRFVSARLLAIVFGHLTRRAVDRSRISGPSRP